MISTYKLKADEWFHYGQWEQPPLSASFWVHWHNRDIVEKIGIKHLDGRIIMVNGHTIVYKKDLEILKARLKKACENNDKLFFERLNKVSLEILDLVAFKARGFLKEVAKKLKLNYEELLLLTPTEINAYLEKKTRPTKSDMAKRNKGFCILVKSGKEIVASDPREVADFIKELVPQKDLSAKQFEGIVAREGRVKGTVKVFLIPEEFSKMKQGDILVTTMTTPDFIPLMQKAAAIVTDIGGLLSHAAIVSREMGKPCVIGTEIATKVLKDGDLIEVDANKGIVKILKRAKK